MIPSIFISILVSSYSLDASIYPPTMLLTLILLSSPSKDTTILERWFSWPISFDENLVVVYFRSLVYYERCSISDLRRTSSFTIFVDSSWCISINWFSYSCCFSNVWSYLLDLSSDVANIYWSFLKTKVWHKLVWCFINCGKLSGYSNVLTGDGLCVCEGIHSE